MLPWHHLELPWHLENLWLPVLLEHQFLLLVLPELQYDPGLLVLPGLLLLLLGHLWHLVSQRHLVLQYFPWEDPVLLRLLGLQRHLELPSYPGRHFVLPWLPGFPHCLWLLELLEHRFEHLELLELLGLLVVLVSQ